MFSDFFNIVWSVHQHRFHEAEVNLGFLLHFMFVLILIVCFLVFVITKPLVHFMRNTSKAALKNQKKKKKSRSLIPTLDCTENTLSLALASVVMLEHTLLHTLRCLWPLVCIFESLSVKLWWSRATPRTRLRLIKSITRCITRWRRNCLLQ